MAFLLESKTYYLVSFLNNERRKSTEKTTLNDKLSSLFILLSGPYSGLLSRERITFFFNVSKVCLYAFFLCFYELDKHFYGGGRVKPLKPTGYSVAYYELTSPLLEDKERQ